MKKTYKLGQVISTINGVDITVVGFRLNQGNDRKDQGQNKKKVGPAPMYEVYLSNGEVIS